MQDSVFTSDRVIRLTGVTPRQLAYWLENKIVAADIDEAKGRGRVRLFSFRNLVEIRVAVWLRDKVSLQLVRKIVVQLRSLGWDEPLVDLSFAVVEKRRGRTTVQDVYVKDAAGEWEHWSGQGVAVLEVTVPLVTFEEELRVAAELDGKRRRRPGKVERRRGTLGSAEVLKGTRVPVAAIQRLSEAGYSADRILDEYPGLKRADVTAALRSIRRTGSRSA